MNKKIFLSTLLSCSVLFSGEISSSVNNDLKQEYSNFNESQVETPVPSLSSNTLDSIKSKMKIVLNERINILEKQKVCIDSSQSEEDLISCRENSVYEIRESINKVRDTESK